MSKNLIAKFEVDDIDAVFCIYSSYGIEKSHIYELNNGESKRIDYEYPVFFDDISATRIDENGEETDYAPSGEAWSGRKYDVYDMIEGFISALTRGNSAYKKIYLDEKLEKLVSSYTDNTVNVEGKSVVKNILSNDMGLYQLTLVTEKHIYYSYEDSVIMISSETNNVISDNYFAYEGLLDAIENIKEGNETALYKNFKLDNE